MTPGFSVTNLRDFLRSDYAVILTATDYNGIAFLTKHNMAEIFNELLACPCYRDFLCYPAAASSTEVTFPTTPRQKAIRLLAAIDSESEAGTDSLQGAAADTKAFKRAARLPRRVAVTPRFLAFHWST